MIKEKDKLGTLDTWINPEVISNIISITKIEKSGYCITYDTKEEWVVYTPEGKNIIIKRDSGECEGMKYVELINTEPGIAAIKTVRNIFEGYTK